MPKRRDKLERIASAKVWKHAQKLAQPIPGEIVQARHPSQRHAQSELREAIYEIIEMGPYVRYRLSRGQAPLHHFGFGQPDDYPPLPFIPAGF